MVGSSQDPQFVRLETQLRERLLRSEERLAESIAQSKRVLAEFEQGLTVPPDGSMAVRNAHVEESRARQEYMESLRAFTDLTLYGVVPDEK